MEKESCFKVVVGQAMPDVKQGEMFLPKHCQGKPNLHTPHPAYGHPLPQGAREQRGGFTLIELLVVVLIIGILAAVALPQYQKAVEKSKATQAITMLKSIGQAQTAYRLANGTCAATFEELDVDVPFTGTKTWRSIDGKLTDTRSDDDWSFQLFIPAAGSYCIMMAGRISGKYQGGGFFYYVGSTQDGVLRCAERTSAGVSLSGEEGRYCAQLFKGTLAASDSSSREYNLP